MGPRNVINLSNETQFWKLIFPLQVAVIQPLLVKILLSEDMKLHNVKRVRDLRALSTKGYVLIKSFPLESGQNMMQKNL